MSKENKKDQEEIQKIKNILGKNPMFMLFSASMVVEGRRKFIDIPIISVDFPHRNNIFMYCMQFLDIEEADAQTAIVPSFAILNIYEFKSQKHYEEFIGEPVIPIEENEIADE